jgi:hypothetical protein
MRFYERGRNNLDQALESIKMKSVCIKMCFEVARVIAISGRIPWRTVAAVRLKQNACELLLVRVEKRPVSVSNPRAGLPKSD